MRQGPELEENAKGTGAFEKIVAKNIGYFFCPLDYKKIIGSYDLDLDIFLLSHRQGVPRDPFLD